MKVGFYDPYVTDGYEKVLGIKRFNTLDELKSNSSIISINASLNLKTKNMVDEKLPLILELAGARLLMPKEFAIKHAEEYGFLVLPAI